MAIKLKISKGTRKDEEFLVRGDIVIGRSSGDLALRDHKVSNPHCKISLISENNIEIEDLGSSNGTYINDKKTKKGTIKPGDTLRLGRTILSIEPDDGQKEAKPSGFDKGSWQEEVFDALKKGEGEGLKKDPANFEPFSSPMSLEVVQGILTGSVFTFGYGPRTVGSHSSDATISVEAFPSEAFEIRGGQDGSWQIKPSCKDVLLNGTQLEHQTLLQVDDRISVNSVSFKVRIAEET